jgi:NAD(P)-dependent dehydrogenase (short-subunit alcohol dehydrogenase family)
VELGLAGKIAIVTGASEGIGRAVAQRLAEEGALLAMCARRADVLQRAAQEIAAAAGTDVLAVPADVTRPPDLERLVQATVDRYGRIDILVNNAGRSAAAPVEAVPDEAWQADLDLKLLAAVRLTRFVVPHLRRAGGGAIVNMTTVGGKAPGAASLPTSVSRAAGIAFTKAASQDLARDRIRVNTVCLGMIKSMQWVRRVQAQGIELDEFYRRQGQQVPLGRVGEAEEVADLVVFLVSDRAAYITGAAINIDGGLGATV